MRRELEMLQRELESVGSPVVFCHNDLIPANIVYDEKKGGLRLIKLSILASSQFAINMCMVVNFDMKTVFLTTNYIGMLCHLFYCL